MAFAVVGKKSAAGPGIRPLLVQKMRPGPAYQYGPASIYNACSLMPLGELRRRGLIPDPDQYLDEYYPGVSRPELR